MLGLFTDTFFIEMLDELDINVYLCSFCGGC